MKINLKPMTRKELEKLRAEIDKTLAVMEKKEMKEALAAAEKAAKAHGFTLADITGRATSVTKTARKTAKKPKKAGIPKYANPDDKTQTWTGKGRYPDWFRAALAAGKTLEQLKI
ncbi:H-NS family nucleoid-associated regulatory protein [Yoonia sp. R2-816]|uniref:H-NS histone family protein n=1 Tax=Yoonia sp. R2-816 TaxID=3342638 RepID=UPI00372A22A6